MGRTSIFMAHIPQHPTLAQLQQYQADVCAERGWGGNDDYQTWLLFTEEIGELAKAIRDQKKLVQEVEKVPTTELQEEFADVLGYLMDLANRFGVDLAEAYRAKEAKNEQRNWH